MFQTGLSELYAAYKPHAGRADLAPKASRPTALLPGPSFTRWLEQPTHYFQG